MAYVEDYARSWSPRRKATSIERSVDRAVAQTAADQRAFSRQCRAEQRASVATAKALVGELPEVVVARMASKQGLTPKQGRAALLSRASVWPDQVAQLCRVVIAQAGEA